MCIKETRFDPAPYSELQPLPALPHRGDTLTMDFIRPAPKTSHGHSGLLLMVNEFRKMLYLAAVPAHAPTLVVARISRHSNTLGTSLSDISPHHCRMSFTTALTSMRSKQFFKHVAIVDVDSTSSNGSATVTTNTHRSLLLTSPTPLSYLSHFITLRTVLFKGRTVSSSRPGFTSNVFDL